MNGTKSGASPTWWRFRLRMIWAIVRAPERYLRLMSLIWPWRGLPDGSVQVGAELFAEGSRFGSAGWMLPLDEETGTFCPTDTALSGDTHFMYVDCTA